MGSAIRENHHLILTGENGKPFEGSASQKVGPGRFDRSHAPAWERRQGRSGVPFGLNRISHESGLPHLQRWAAFAADDFQPGNAGFQPAFSRKTEGEMLKHRKCG